MALLDALAVETMDTLLDRLSQCKSLGYVRTGRILLLELRFLLLFNNKLYYQTDCIRIIKIAPELFEILLATDRCRNSDTHSGSVALLYNRRISVLVQTEKKGIEKRMFCLSRLVYELQSSQRDGLERRDCLSLG